MPDLDFGPDPRAWTLNLNLILNPAACYQYRYNSILISLPQERSAIFL